MLIQEESVSILLYEVHNTYKVVQAVLQRREFVYGTEMPDRWRTEWGTD